MPKIFAKVPKSAEKGAEIVIKVLQKCLTLGGAAGPTLEAFKQVTVPAAPRRVEHFRNTIHHFDSIFHHLYNTLH